MVEGLGEPGGEGEQGLTRARGPEQGDEVDLGVHQQVEREALLAVARRDAPHRVVRGAVVRRELEGRALALAAAHDRLEVPGRALVDELVRVPVAGDRTGDPVEGADALLPGFDRLREPVPEIARQLRRAPVEQVDVVEDLVAVVVLGGDAEHVRLDPQVDVLGHQDDGGVLALGLQGPRGGQDGIVEAAARQALGQAVRVGAGLEEQAAAGGGRGARVLRRGQLDAVLDPVPVGAVHELVEEAARLADVARDLRDALLGPVELLEHDHGQVHVVLLEAKDGRRVVHQDVRVEHEHASARGVLAPHPVT